ncbi:MAG: amidophosphoribosyltransferase [Burkholderiales bacterium]|uniref:amidophosphoribosyltransferase n=1 Tax=uncultured Turicimonas sp. TaxID=1918607 RepID=UPI001EC09E8A|nr:amidophosphoribosyltransferase [uncultured Turicimonas sp.]MBS4846559.1 amidophosphoribosyltransferase [Burkholderiales bacterium]
MCGIVALYSSSPVNQRLYDALLLLQHRGQDAAGICTVDGRTFHMHKAMGLVRDVFRTRNMRDLLGNCGIGQVRYPTQGNAGSNNESQPFYVNAPYGLVMAHNGNLTNAETLLWELYDHDRRHINTTSDSEVLLNVFANELQLATQGKHLDEDCLFDAIKSMHKRLKGSYAVVCMISGHGLVAFRDPHGLRPLCIGTNTAEDGTTEYMVASESVALEGSEFKLLRDVEPGEAIWIDEKGNFHSRQCAEDVNMAPCIFEYVYLARPDSTIDGISVYAARLRLGEKLAEEIKKTIPLDEIDVVMPIPDSSRPAAAQLAKVLGLEYREGFIKNRYVGRTFIMPGQAIRKKSVRQKLNAMPVEFKDKRVLLVDDSIVRGTTITEIVKMARQSGARKVYVASGAPPVRFPNVYGIDMPTTNELIAGNGKDVESIRKEIGADALVYQTIEGMREAVGGLNPAVPDFDCSCFDGRYVTGDVSPAYLNFIEGQRKAAKEAKKKAEKEAEKEE